MALLSASRKGVRNDGGDTHHAHRNTTYAFPVQHRILYCISVDFHKKRTMRIAVLFFAALILMVASVGFAVSATKGDNNGLTIWLLSMVNIMVAIMNNEKYKNN